MKKKYMVPTTVIIKASLPNLLTPSKYKVPEDQDNFTAKQNNFYESGNEIDSVRNFNLWDEDE